MIVIFVFILILVFNCVMVLYILELRFGVFIMVVIMIIDNVSMMFWLILVRIVFVVSGSCILNRCWDVVELNVFVVLIRLVGICLILRIVMWIVGGIVKIIDVIMFGIMLILKKKIVGSRYMKVGMVCIKLRIGVIMWWIVFFWDVYMLIGILIIMEIKIDVMISVNVCSIGD